MAADFPSHDLFTSCAGPRYAEASLCALRVANGISWGYLLGTRMRTPQKLVHFAFPAHRSVKKNALMLNPPSISQPTIFLWYRFAGLLELGSVVVPLTLFLISSNVSSEYVRFPRERVFAKIVSFPVWDRRSMSYVCNVMSSFLESPECHMDRISPDCWKRLLIRENRRPPKESVNEREP